MLGGEQRRNALQGSACIIAHHDIFAHLYKVGQMGGNVQPLRALTVGRTVGQQFDAYSFADPVGAGFQVVQKNFVQGFFAVQAVFQLGLAVTQPLPHAKTQKLQDQITFALHGIVKIRNFGTMLAFRRQRSGQLLVKTRGGNAQRQAALAVIMPRKAHQQVQLLGAAQRKRQIVQVIQQRKRFFRGKIAVGVKRKQHMEQLGLVLGGGIVEQALHHQL